MGNKNGAKMRIFNKYLIISYIYIEQVYLLGVGLLGNTVKKAENFTTTSLQMFV